MEKFFYLRTTTGLRDCESRLLKYFSFVSICKYLLTAGLREQAFNVTQLWPGILKFSHKYECRLINTNPPLQGQNPLFTAPEFSRITNPSYVALIVSVLDLSVGKTLKRNKNVPCPSPYTLNNPLYDHLQTVYTLASF